YENKPPKRFYLKRIARSNRIRRMSVSRDSWVFTLTLMAGAAVLVSIAGAETLLAMACLAWALTRRRPIVWPSYMIPLCAFMLTTLLALLISPEPGIGMRAVRKFVRFAMGLLAATCVSILSRGRISHGVLLAVGTAALK